MDAAPADLSTSHRPASNVASERFADGEKHATDDKFSDRVCAFLKSVSRNYGVCAAVNAALAVATGTVATGALVYGVVRVAEVTSLDVSRDGAAQVAGVLGQRVLLVWVLVTLSKLCFQYSRVCLAEARRHSNRKHIVELGQLYVESNPGTATWATLSKTLKDWDRLDGDADLEKVEPTIEANMDGLAGLITGKAAASVPKG